MLVSLYLLSAVAGGLMLLTSLFGGHDSHADHPGVVDHDTGGQDVDSASLASWFSLRSLTFFSAFFGATGLALHYIAATPELLGLGLSLAVGGLSGLMSRVVSRHVLASSELTGGTSRDEDLIGKEATVTLGIEAKSSGRVRLDQAGTVVELQAEADGVAIDEQATVLIVDVKQGVAKVTRLATPAGLPSKGK